MLDPLLPIFMVDMVVVGFPVFPRPVWPCGFGGLNRTLRVGVKL